MRHLWAYHFEDAAGDAVVWIGMELAPHGALSAVLERGWPVWVHSSDQLDLRVWVIALRMRVLRLRWRGPA